MSPRAEKLVCRDDGTMYPDVKTAARAHNLSANAVYAALSGARKTAGGHRWTYTDADGLPLGEGKSVELTFPTPEQAAWFKALLAYESTMRGTTPEVACLRMLEESADLDSYPQELKDKAAGLGERTRKRAATRAMSELEAR